MFKHEPIGPMHEDEHRAACLARQKWLLVERHEGSPRVLALVEAADAAEALRRGAAAVRPWYGPEGCLEAVPLTCEEDDPPLCSLCRLKERDGYWVPFCFTCLLQVADQLNIAKLLPR